MKTNLKNKLSALIERYKAEKAPFAENYRATLEAFNEPTIRKRYSDEGMWEVTQEKKNELLDDLKATCATYNQTAKAIVEDAKKAIVGAVMGTPSRTADYSTRVSNALNFLDRETAETITDDVLYSILKDFTGDFEQMGLFKRVIEGKVGPGTVIGGQTDYPKTFGEYAKANSLLQTFDEIDPIVENIFIHPKSDGLPVINAGGINILTPDDGYTEMANWDTLLELAGAVDRLDPGEAEV